MLLLVTLSAAREASWLPCSLLLHVLRQHGEACYLQSAEEILALCVLHFQSLLPPPWRRCPVLLRLLPLPPEPQPGHPQVLAPLPPQLQLQPRVRAAQRPPEHLSPMLRYCHRPPEPPRVPAPLQVSPTPLRLLPPVLARRCARGFAAHVCALPPTAAPSLALPHTRHHCLSRSRQPLLPLSLQRWCRARRSRCLAQVQPSLPPALAWLWMGAGRHCARPPDRHANPHVLPPGQGMAWGRTPRWSPWTCRRACRHPALAVTHAPA
jgi:hypothetical protein